MKEIVCPRCGQIARNDRETCALCGAPLKRPKPKGHGALIALLLILALLILGGAGYVLIHGVTLPLPGRGEPAPAAQPEEILPAGEEIIVEPSLPETEEPAAQAAPAEAEAAPAETAAAPNPAADWRDVARVYTTETYTLGLCTDGTVLLTGEGDAEALFDLSGWTEVTELCPARSFVAGLRADGTVLVTGDTRGMEDVPAWENVVALCTDGESLLAALRGDGTVCASSPEVYDVADWQGVEELAIGRNLILGRTAAGRVLAAGDLSYARGVEDWENVRQLMAGMESTFGLSGDGTVLCDGAYLDNEENGLGRDPVFSWGGVDRLLAVGYHPIGVDSLGYLRLYTQPYREGSSRPVYTAEKALVIPATGASLVLDREGRVGYYDFSGAYDGSALSGWTEVEDLVCGFASAAALRRDGTVLVLRHGEDPAYDTAGWTEITQIAMAGQRLVGLRADGTVLLTGAY